MIVKPWVAFLLPWVWRTGGASDLVKAAAVLTAASLVVASFQGVWIFVDYLSGDVHQRLPGWMLTQDINQSLLAVLARLRESSAVEQGHPLGLYYLVGALPLLLLGAWRLVQSHDSLIGLAISIQAALLFYPSTLEHYCVVAMIPLLILWVRCRRANLQAACAMTLIALYVGLSGANAFWANLGLWATLVALDIRRAGANVGPRARRQSSR